MISKLLLSIAIPTKNRQKYCKEAILTILENKQDYFELIIQDNSDDSSLDLFVKTINDRRLKYYYTSRPLSSIENVNLSVERTIGEFVCMIGDDDTVLPYLFEMVEYAKKEKIDSICPTCLPSYVWPNKGEEGFLKISQLKNKDKVTTIDVAERLSQLFKNGIIDYQQYYLPRLYHGIIHRNILEQIKAEIGAYFGGLSPDIYSTVAISSIVKKHILINKPISIAGACPESTTAQNQKGAHRGKLEDAPHLKNKEDYEWDELIPRYYSVETIWAESAMTAARDFKLATQINNFDPVYLFLVSLKNNKNIKEIVIKESFKKFKISKVLLGFPPFCYKYLKNGINRIIYKKINKRVSFIDSVKNIREVIDIISN